MLLIALLLAAVTFGVYARIGGHDFINYDDPSYVTKNPRVTDGLTVDGVVWAFTGSHSSNWHPLTSMSHMLDVQLFGLDAGKHHLTGVVLHALNAALCFLALLALTRRAWPSVVVAALFALHPLRVESVAWISERKDLLSGTFFFLTLLAYARYARAPSRGKYATVAACLALGLMSKPMLVTLPFVLLLLDRWPLERSGDLSWKRLVLEKLPLFGLVALSAIVTVIVQRADGTVGTLDALPLDIRLLNAAGAYAAYLWLTLVPLGLSVFYPHPALVDVDPTWTLFVPAIVGGVVLVVVSVMALRRLSTAPYLLTGWLWFVGMLVPVICILQVGSQAYADRYAYLPLVGVYIVVVFALADLVRRRPGLRQPAGIAAVAVIGACGFLTWQQAGRWKDSETLFTHALAVTEQNYVAHNNLGLAYLKQLDPARAADEFRAANGINPVFYESRFNLALALEQQGLTDEARAQYETVLRMRPGDRDAQLRIGAMIEQEGDAESARAHYEGLVQTDPGNTGAWSQLARINLEAGEPEAAARCAQQALELDDQSLAAHILMGSALEELGDVAGALEHFTTAIQLDPDDAGVRARFGRALANANRLDEATRHLERALADEPEMLVALVDLAKILVARGDELTARTYVDRALAVDALDADANDVAGFMHFQAGRMQDAERCFRQAIETDPGFGSAYNNLAHLLESGGREREAVETYRRLLEADPRSKAIPNALRALAWLLATSADDSVFNGEEAEGHAERAIQASPNPNDPRLGEVMAAAKAAAGHFEDAVRIQKQAAEMLGEHPTRAAAEERLKLYEAHRPFRRKR